MSGQPAGVTAERVLVTGASGFLGRHLVASLEMQGYEVIATSRSSGFRLLDDQLPLEGVSHVFHLAGETGVVGAWNDPTQFHLINTHGTVRVLEQCRKSGCSLTFVGAYIYGIPRFLPITEDHPVQPNNPYAFSKWMAEEACRWYAEEYGMAITALRLFNVYGPGQSDRFLIPRIVDQVLDSKQSAIELMDLAPKRDYLHVEDAIRAFVQSRAKSGFNVFNVGSGSSHSVAEVVELVMTSCGIQKPVIDKGQARPNEIPDVVADFGRIRAFCGWEPRIDLKTGIRTMHKASNS
jgi:nucleoside-diphosphate-sugar epimerase